MLAADLRILRQASGWPCVSVLCDAGRSEWTALLADAHDRLAEIAEPEPVETLVTALGRAEADLSRNGWPSFGAFASPGFSHAVALPHPVRERVVVDDTFATRDLVAGIARSPRYLVVALDGDGARLWAGLGSRIVPEPDAPSFPVSFPDPRDGAERRHRRERSRWRDAHVDRCHRELDDALAASLRDGDRRPIFVVGDGRRVHRFAATTRHADRIAAVVAGDPRADESTLGDLVAPHLDDELASRSAAALESVGASIGQSRFASGLPEIWDLAGDGRIELLVVEEDFHQPGDIEPATGQLVPIERFGPGSIDDAVDEAIEVVLDHGGDVEIVASEHLEQWGRIAARLRH